MRTFPADQYKSIFGNFEDIKEFTKKFSKVLDGTLVASTTGTAKKDPAIGKAFLDNVRKFFVLYFYIENLCTNFLSKKARDLRSLYSPYISSHVECLKNLIRARRGNYEFLFSAVIAG